MNENEKKSTPVQIIRLSILGLLVVAVIAFKMISSSMIENKLDEALSEIPQGMISYENASMDLFGFDIHVSDIKVNISGSPEKTIEEIVIHSFDNENKIPEYLNIEVNGIETNMDDLKINTEMSKIVDGLDYKEFKSDLVLNYSFDKEKKEIDIKEFSMRLQDAGEIKFKAELGGINSLEQLPMLLFANQRALLIGESSIVYKDNSLTKRLFEMSAKNAGITVDELKQNLINDFSASLNKENKYEVAFSEALIKYIKNPKSFEIEIDPKEKISLSSMQRATSPEDLLKLLNLEISAN